MSTSILQVGPTTLKPGDKTLALAVASNFGDEPVDATLTITTGALVVTKIDQRTWACTNAGGAITCTRHFLAHEDGPVIDLSLQSSSSPDGGRFFVTSHIESVPPLAHPVNDGQLMIDVYRTFTVTSSGDDGAGTLRDAIQQANTRCDNSVLCRIAFSGAMTIEPRTPLPAITGCQVLIDGEIAPSGFYATRRIEISGAKVPFGNGLELRSACGGTVEGVAINRFPENGIVIATSAGTVEVEGCSIGTNADGTAARPNGLRGVSIESDGAAAALLLNIISGNTRSGVWMSRGTTLTMSGNRIGLGVNYESLGNGASGVFINAGVATSQNDLIATNREFGIAVGAGAMEVGVRSDILLNGGPQIDYGLDGPTPSDPSGHMPPVPQLIDATYDPAHNQTLVRFVVPEVGIRQDEFYSVSFYAGVVVGPDTNTQVYGGGRVVFGTTQTAALAGDLRGLTIYGTTENRQFPDSFYFATSEYSAPLVIPK